MSSRVNASDLKELANLLGALDASDGSFNGTISVGNYRDDDATFTVAYDDDSTTHYVSSLVEGTA